MSVTVYMMIDKKNALLIVVVLAVAGIFGVVIPYLQTRNVQQEPLPVATSTDHTIGVSYTNGGFEPNIVTIKVGTTVSWTNTSDKLMWVASDPHPSHTDLPGFDERGTMGNDDHINQIWPILPVAYAHTGITIYKYTFFKEGRWGYHNHLVPNDRGVVIVIP